VTTDMAVGLFDSLAADYEGHFDVVHRRAYDQLAWEFVTELLPRQPGLVLDVGCGVARWAGRLLDLGHRYVGVEPAPRMAARARAAYGHRPNFEIQQAAVETAALPDALADVTLAMGSLQYSREPQSAVHRLARWTRPGGVVCVLVDSKIALVLELLRDGRTAEAAERMRTGQGSWVQRGRSAPLHLFDPVTLAATLVEAGLDDVTVSGLLVGGSAIGRDALCEALSTDYEGRLATERSLASRRELADFGKQLLAIGRRAHARPPT
jgi:SAM-dependent methyltransferase